MGRVKWFRSKDLLMLLYCAKDVIAAVSRFIAQHIPNNHKAQKGGATSRKKSERKK